MSGAITTVTGPAPQGMPFGAKAGSDGGASFAPELKLARDLLDGPLTRLGGRSRATPGPATPVEPTALGLVGELTQIPALSLMLKSVLTSDSAPVDASAPVHGGDSLPGGDSLHGGAPLPGGASLPSGVPVTKGTLAASTAPDASPAPDVDDTADQAAPVASAAQGIPATAVSVPVRGQRMENSATHYPTGTKPVEAMTGTKPLKADAAPAVPAVSVQGTPGVVPPGTTPGQQAGVLGSHLSTASRAGVERESPSGTQAANGVPAQPVTVPQAPASQAPTLQAAAAPTPAGPAQPPVPLAAQLYKPVFSLASAAPGEHLITVRVAPDEFGPVTVRATVNAEGMRVELFAPTDAAREALRGILPELRRDLSAPGLYASLDVSTKDPSDDGGPASDDQDDAAQRDPTRDLPAPAGDYLGNIPPDEPATRGPGWHHSTLDLLA